MISRPELSTFHAEATMTTENTVKGSNFKPVDTDFKKYVMYSYAPIC